MAAQDPDPLSLLTDDLKDNDIGVAVTAANRLTAVAAALGPRRVSNDLIPALPNFIQVPIDEVLAAIARQIGNVFDLAGGGNSPAVLNLLPILETLAAEEEVVVRTHAANSLAYIIPKLPKAEVVSKVLPLYKRLATAEWFAGRVSACGFTPSLYASLSDTHQSDVKQTFLVLSADETPMVRRAAGQVLGQFALKLPKTHIKPDILPVIRSLAVDDRDTLRSLSLDSIAEIGAKIDPSDYTSAFLPLIEGLLDDHSWRVRQYLGQIFAKLCAGHPDATSAKRLVPLYAKLLKDRSVEVRAAAMSSLASVAKSLGPSGVDALLALLECPYPDTAEPVKTELSTNLLQLCPSIPKESVAKYVVPLFQNLTKDEKFEVRNNLAEGLDALIDSVSPAVLSATLLPTLMEMGKDPKWRVRIGVVSRFGKLAQVLGVKIFEKKVQPVLVLALSDHVYAIRERACEQLGQVVKAFGSQWAIDKLFPPGLALYDRTQNYLHRMTCLFFVLHTASSCPGDVIEKHLLQLVITALTDDVANVKVAAAKCLIEIIPKVDKKIVSAKIKPQLIRNVDDPDHDVAYFSSLAVKLCG